MLDTTRLTDWVGAGLVGRGLDPRDGPLVYREATLRERWRVRRSSSGRRGLLTVDDGDGLVVGRLYVIEQWGADGGERRVGYVRLLGTHGSGVVGVEWVGT